MIIIAHRGNEIQFLVRSCVISEMRGGGGAPISDKLSSINYEFLQLLLGHNFIVVQVQTPDNGLNFLRTCIEAVSLEESS